MAFESIQALWLMGGYGFYVWLSVAVSIGAIVLLWLFSVRQRQALKRYEQGEIDRQQRIKKALSRQQSVTLKDKLDEPTS